MWIILSIVCGFITGAAHLWLIGGFTDVHTICSILLLHQFVVTFGQIGIVGLITNIILADWNARTLGWPGGPFQYKYGFSQVGLGIMGVMCIWFRNGFWLGTLVYMYIYGISGLWSHVAEMKRRKQVTVTDVGNIIIDILHQISLTVLSIYAGGVWTY